MREIKFRVWDGKKMESFLLDNDFDCITGWIGESPLMQYTGLKDKNGKEIYEGDIVEFKANYSVNPNGWMEGKVVITEYRLELHSKNGFIYSADEETDEFPHNVEVLGNIHENPDLIKQ